MKKFIVRYIVNISSLYLVCSYINLNMNPNAWTVNILYPVAVWLMLSIAIKEIYFLTK